MSSITSSTEKQYLKPIEDWVSFCSGNKYNFFKPNEQWVIEWLVKKFNEGSSYSCLNTYRSAISFLCGDYIGKSPLICRLLRGVFKLRPSKPKYDRIYSLDPVLECLEKLDPLSDLTFKELTTKLLLILALITAHRKQTLSLIKRSNIKKTREGYEIEISDAIKTSRPGVCQPLLILRKFNDNPKLCAVLALEQYLKVTSFVETDFLFITIKRPYRAASKDTISRWIRSFLAECGINPKYAPHSVRHAATSSALAKGVDVDIIKKLAGWSKTSNVFNTFYNRPIVKDNNDFAKAILS